MLRTFLFLVLSTVSYAADGDRPGDVSGCLPCRYELRPTTLTCTVQKVNCQVFVCSAGHARFSADRGLTFLRPGDPFINAPICGKGTCVATAIWRGVVVIDGGLLMRVFTCPRGCVTLRNYKGG